MPMPDHRTEATDENVHHDWDDDRDPILTVEPGVVVRFECRDASDGEVGVAAIECPTTIDVRFDTFEDLPDSPRFETLRSDPSGRVRSSGRPVSVPAWSPPRGINSGRCPTDSRSAGSAASVPVCSARSPRTSSFRRSSTIRT